MSAFFGFGPRLRGLSARPERLSSSSMKAFPPSGRPVCVALRWDPTLKAVHERELERGNRNRATVAVARKLVARLPAVDKRYSRFMAAHAAHTE